MERAHIFKSLALCLTLSSVLSACGQNNTSDTTKQAEGENLRKELAEMQSELKSWSKELKEALRGDKIKSDSLSPKEREARRDSIVQHIEVQFERSAEALERWIEKNGPEVEVWTQTYAVEIEGWVEEHAEDIEAQTDKLSEDIADWAENMADKLEQAAERAEKKRKESEELK